MTAYLRTAGKQFTDPVGQPIRLRGIGLGGWTCMENFVTGYPGTESMMRAAVRKVLGDDLSQLFFDELLTAFFQAGDARLLASANLNTLRIPVSYKHFEDDARPFQIKENGFRHLDRVIGLCADAGIYSVIDLHTVPGWQNQRWHCDNPTHVATFWDHPHFQDRVVHLWEEIAGRYRDNPWVAGYNPVNEPGDESREVVGPFYKRLVAAIRAVDPNHILFLDGNTYSTDFDIFGVFGEPPDNVVYVCHDYAMPGFAYGGPYPGYTRDTWHDKGTVEQKFLERSEFSRKTGTPVWVGEFGPVYTGNPGSDAQRLQLLEDQLGIYSQHDASWSLWTYKDIGLQGLVHAAPESAYLRRFSPVMLKKKRLAVDAWGSDGVGPAEVTAAVQDLVEREFGEFDPYPWGRWDWVKTLLNTITFAQPMVEEYAALFRGLDERGLRELARSFALENCVMRKALLQLVTNG